jgi:two-component system phosphate regulon response regulator PhoB
MLPSPQTIPGRKILVVDDEEDLTTLVAFHLRKHGFRVETVNDPRLFLSRLNENPPDLVILDVMMPELDGIQLCRMLRADPRFKRLPVVFLSARGEEPSRIRGLEVGADDYIAKPFSPAELVLRIHAIFRRVEDETETIPVLSVGEVVLDIEHHTVTVDDLPVQLTATEFRLLKLLMERLGRVQTRDHLLVTVWNYETEIETRTVDTHMRRLREKLGRAGALIKTVRGVGYRMMP